MARSSRPSSDEYQPFLNEQQGNDDFVEDYHAKQKSRRRLIAAIVLLVSIVLVAGIIGAVYVSVSRDGSSDKSQFVFKTAAVAADTVLCSKVGKSILQKGGNAVDASLATLICSGLTCPQSMGIGGGHFMTIYNRTTGETTTIDARETAPGKATKDMFVDDPSASYTGGLSIGVPGEVKGYWHTHQRYGSVAWSDLFEPAIEMARDGFPTPGSLADALQDSKEAILSEDSFRSVYLNPETGKLYTEGEIMKRPKLAKTLQVISEKGPQAFYDGELTDDIMADLKDAGSIISRGDLLNYTVLEKPPMEIQLTSGTRVMSLPSPSGGPVLAFILNVMDGYGFGSKDMSSEDSATLTYHRIIETFKFAYALRSQLGDEDFVDVTNLVNNMTSRKFADHIRTSLITDDHTHNTSYYGGTFFDRFTTSTSHLSVVDQFGNAVSVTSTINGRFGSKRKGNRTGIIFNNEMDDFSSPNITSEWGIKPSPANFIVPGKRPLSSMCPAVLVDSNGDVVGVYGAAGGSKITTATSWVIAHSLWLGHDIQEAVERPRLHHQLLPPFVQYESTFTDKDVLKGLEAKGHDVQSYHVGGSIVQAIKVINDAPIGQKGHQIHAASDYRKGGEPAGF